MPDLSSRRARVNRLVMRARLLLAIHSAQQRDIASVVNAVTSFDPTSLLPKPKRHSPKRPGQMIIDLFNGSDVAFEETLGMHKRSFKMLVAALVKYGGLEDSKHVSKEEQLGIFLHWLKENRHNRSLQQEWNRSADTVHRYIRKMVKLFLSPDIYNRYVQLPSRNAPVPPEIDDDPEFGECRGALGAIDGTKIEVRPPAGRAKAFRTYKSQVHLHQNVLAVVSFDLRFLYLKCGWEGTAGDARMMDDARKRSLRVPEGRYYLGDAAFCGSDVCVAPFPKTAYHLQQYRRRENFSVRNKKELFNLRHSKLRMVVERAFGVIKRAHQVIKTETEYPWKRAKNLPYVCAVIHNFLVNSNDPVLGKRIAEEIAAEEDEEVEEEDPRGDVQEQGELMGPERDEERAAMKRIREDIAERMWVDHERETDRREGRRRRR